MEKILYCENCIWRENCVYKDYFPVKVKQELGCKSTSAEEWMKRAKETCTRIKREQGEEE